MMLFLSVIVPIYKVEKYLSECIESILGQTYRNLEIILVDDGGNDKCPLICDRYAEKDKRVKVIHKENGGLVSARKAGLKAASGEYIAFVDGDDSIDECMYETMCPIAERTNADIVIEGFKFIYPDKVVTWKDNVPAGEYDKRRLEQYIYPVMMCHDNKLTRNVAPAIWNKIFKKELLNNILGEMNEGIRDGEDAAVTYPCLLSAEKVVFITDQHHYKYRINTESISRSFDKVWYVSASEYCNWMEQKVSKKKASLEKSVSLEKFMMLYRYLNREYAFCMKNKEESFEKRMQEIIENTEVGKSLFQIDLWKMEIPFFEKLQYRMLQHKRYGFCKIFCWIHCKYGELK